MEQIQEICFIHPFLCKLTCSICRSWWIFDMVPAQRHNRLRKSGPQKKPYHQFPRPRVDKTREPACREHALHSFFGAGNGFRFRRDSGTVKKRKENKDVKKKSGGFNSGEKKFGRGLLELSRLWGVSVGISRAVTNDLHFRRSDLGQFVQWSTKNKEQKKSGVQNSGKTRPAVGCWNWSRSWMAFVYVGVWEPLLMAFHFCRGSWTVRTVKQKKTKKVNAGYSVQAKKRSVVGC